jgi:hypothetical protein
MPLSDQERRILDEIERGITHAPTPALASVLRSTRRVRQSWIAWALAFVCGLALLAFGLRTTSGVGTVAGVLGYLLIVFSTHQTVTAMQAHRRSRQPRDV